MVYLVVQGGLGWSGVGVAPSSDNGPPTTACAAAETVPMPTSGGASREHLAAVDADGMR